MHIFVTGGTGFLGRHLVHALLAQKHQVRVLGRNLAVCAELEKEGVEVVRGDLREREAVLSACAGVEAVCHVGALSAPWGRKADFLAVNVDGTAHVIEGCQNYKIRRLVYISSPSVVFAGKDQENVTEEVPYPRRFASVYSWTKKLGEDLVNQTFRNGSSSFLETVILRPKAIFGPGDTSLLPRLLEAARRQRLPQIGPGENRVDLTYVDNAVHAIMLALNSPNAVGKTYHITNGEHILLWPLIIELFQHLGLPAKLRRVSFGKVYALAALMELKACLLGGEPTLTRYTASILAKTQTYNIDAARCDLGYEPLVSVAEGVNRTIKAFQTKRPSVING